MTADERAVRAKWWWGWSDEKLAKAYPDFSRIWLERTERGWHTDRFHEIQRAAWFHELEARATGKYWNGVPFPALSAKDRELAIGRFPLEDLQPLAAAPAIGSDEWVNIPCVNLRASDRRIFKAIGDILSRERARRKIAPAKAGRKSGQLSRDPYGRWTGIECIDLQKAGCVLSDYGRSSASAAKKYYRQHPPKS